MNKRLHIVADCSLETFQSVFLLYKIRIENNFGQNLEYVEKKLFIIFIGRQNIILVHLYIDKLEWS